MGLSFRAAFRSIEQVTADQAMEFGIFGLDGQAILEPSLGRFMPTGFILVLGNGGEHQDACCDVLRIKLKHPLCAVDREISIISQCRMAECVPGNDRIRIERQRGDGITV
jgi:hypothetical protein